jgi:tetratricopeptide (TPR) repeat protein
MAENNDKRTRSRRRGMRASRVKLTEALGAAGIRTQAALADRIAELEGLDAAPRDVVYRVFRQQAVDPNTLARVANALGVPLHALLLSSDEDKSPADGAGRETVAASTDLEPRVLARWPQLVAAGAMAAAVFGMVWFGVVERLRPDSAGLPATGSSAAPLRDLSSLGIVVRPFEGDDIQFTDTVREELAPHARVASAGAVAARDPGADAATLAERLGADVVVEGEIRTIGRHAGVRVFAFSDGNRQTIWTTSTTLRKLDNQRSELAAAITLALRRALADNAELPERPSPRAQNAYLEGLFHLDQSRTELNVRRAITRFGASLRDDPNFAQAHAGLCRALLDESVISSDPGTLPDAEQACARAHQLSPDLAAVRRARGWPARRTGRYADAEDIFRAVIADQPEDIDALMGMAETALSVYRNTGDDQARTMAIEFAERANALEPGFWKVPFTLARLHYFTGDIDAAIATAEASVAAQANEHSVTNLGTFYFCRGEHDKALDLYLRASKVTPEASLGAEQMCVAYYFAREFDLAVESCKTAIDLDSAGGSPARHEMWGNFADAYRQVGQSQEAGNAYARAVELAERELLTRGHSPNVRAHLAYYYTVLRLLDPQRVPEPIAAKLEAELTGLLESATDSQAFIRIASAWALLGRLDEARAAYDVGTADCAGFGASPDLDAVRPSNDR